MHGAGNDFILLDDRDTRFPDHDTATIASVCRRRTGIGSEGLMLIRPSDKANFRMRFFNPDGREVDMCGNGARCIARLAFDLGITGRDMHIETPSGILHATIHDDDVQIDLPDPAIILCHYTLRIPDASEILCDLINTGVPHVIVVTDHLDTYPVLTHGRAIREHASFAPEGTNADFITIVNERQLRIRTYERGVEAETLACGTGIVAAAVAMIRQKRITPPVSVTTAGGDTLTVDGKAHGDTVTTVTLTGPAAYAYRGTVDICDPDAKA